MYCVTGALNLIDAERTWSSFNTANWKTESRRLDRKFLRLSWCRPACALAISGLGWIAVEPIGRSLRTSGSDLEETAKLLQLSIRISKLLKIFVGPPIPLGKGGREWYQYRELTEKEMEVRPKWYF
ncbi:hypothetical protein PVL29_020993 [Vitis rotundifolia]|uniref:Uncharacterized protein n=1 Tax=Vitis rotundifolia TaxID=103349 RepID=A0AA38YYA9_VITRO|nr:hypothetical protein PVL29_020993 [Vitis rotundifolia]